MLVEPPGGDAPNYGFNFTRPPGSNSPTDGTTFDAMNSSSPERPERILRPGPDGFPNNDDKLEMLNEVIMPGHMTEVKFVSNEIRKTTLRVLGSDGQQLMATADGEYRLSAGVNGGYYGNSTYQRGMSAVDRASFENGNAINSRYITVKHNQTSNPHSWYVFTNMLLDTIYSVTDAILFFRDKKTSVIKLYHGIPREIFFLSLSPLWGETSF